MLILCCFFQKSIKSIRTKWSNLLRTYKAVVRNQPNNRHPKKFIFFGELDELLKDEPFGSGNIPEKMEENDVSDDTVSESDDESQIVLEYVDENSSVTSANDMQNRQETNWKSNYYRSKISELEDRRQFREKKLQLSISKEERKLRYLQLKEKKYQLAKMQFELNKRKLMVEERNARKMDQ